LGGRGTSLGQVHSAARKAQGTGKRREVPALTSSYIWVGHEGIAGGVGWEDVGGDMSAAQKI